MYFVSRGACAGLSRILAFLLPSQESQGAGLIRDPVLVSDLPNEFSAELFEDRLNNRIFLAFALHVFVRIDV